MPTEFYFEIHTLILTEKLQSHFFASHRNTKQSQVHDVIASVGKTPKRWAKYENLPTQNSYSMYTLTMWY